MKTVLDYFEQVFPGYEGFREGEHDDLQSMPLNCECGEGCRDAIRDAQRFAHHLADAFGEKGDRHPVGKAGYDTLARTTLDICLCFICG